MSTQGDTLRFCLLESMKHAVESILTFRLVSGII